MEKGWYQKGAMLARAKALGFSASLDLFDAWVEKGLLGEASIRIRPRRGSLALWPQEQLNRYFLECNCPCHWIWSHP